MYLTCDGKKAEYMASAIAHSMPLDLMNSGEHGVIAEVSGRPEFVVRLEEMGLHAGARIRMVRPGSPCIIELNHHKISFRLDGSGSVLVDVNQ